MKRIFLSIIFLPLLLLLSASVPEPADYVVDKANVLSGEARQSLLGIIREVEQKTGAEMAVLTIDSTEGEDIFNYAMRIADSWKVGKKGKDNGVLMVVAVKDRKMHILVGYGLEGILPDAKVGRIEDQYIVPYFKQGDYGAGIQNGVKALAGVIAKDAEVQITGTQMEQLPQKYESNRSAQSVFSIIFFIIIVLLFLTKFRLLPFLLLGSRGGFGGFGGGGFGSGGGFGGFGGGGFGGGGAGRGW